MTRHEQQDRELLFSRKYDRGEHAKKYYFKHQRGLRRRLTNHREQAMARKALVLAGNPRVILDLPCGAGRFWRTLAGDPARELYAADNSRNMLEAAVRFHDPELVKRFPCFRTSAFGIGLPDEAVDNIFCMRLLHHIVAEEDRVAILREFYRVTRESVCLSMWVDGNLQARRRKRLERRREKRRYRNRILIPAARAESEYRKAGFRIIGHIDLLPLVSMWRLYVLKKDRTGIPSPFSHGGGCRRPSPAGPD